MISLMYLFFFFQAEDGIRDLIVTGVQTCALPISVGLGALTGALAVALFDRQIRKGPTLLLAGGSFGVLLVAFRSEEHTSELQSRSDLVCRLLLEKKKKKE